MGQCSTQSSANDRPLLGGSGKGQRGRRRGAIIVLTAILLILMMGMLAFSIDVGYMCTLESQLQRSVDAAALAGAGALVDGEDDAQERVVEYLVRNPIKGDAVISGSTGLTSKMSQFNSEHDEDLEVKLGHWDPTSRTFTESDDLPSTISVAMTYPNNPLFFARFLGEDSFSVTASSVAMYQPRDIMVVLDFSASMNDDTEFSSIPILGRSVVEANLLQCWNDLGLNLGSKFTFTPQYITVTASGTNPTTSTEYRYTSAYVVSTHNLQTVTLTFSDNSTKVWNSPGGKTGTFSNGSKVVTKVVVKSNNVNRTMDFPTSTIDTIVKNALGLNSVAYPYTGGSWQEYIDWCQSSSEQNDDHGGYRWKFGGMSLMCYWLENCPAYSQNNALWKTHAQPVTALKDSMEVFMDFIQEVSTDDRVGLAVYNAPDGEGKLEYALSRHDQFAAIASKVQHLQAGHYHSNTNTGAGMKVARQELEQKGRPGAYKMMIVMTDGLPNWVNGSSNVTAATNFVKSEAQLAANDKYPILAISLGAGADTALMQHIADVTPKGKHFNVPGGQTGAQYAQDLYEVFEQIAKDRPLKLVQ